ncbi:indolepyruvate oxidoreductase subunit beta family protein [Agrobacterium tumefaciens]|uniref:indolepyruvate oxidoreductase subunit beta family protein n=1 Tax=Agrobacterium tumefaciens TaxID=358 RepID=UPI001571B45A|nr:indolepyruvate oxidoreductase subunit beta family protein [Agrobacterium tumefaciens]NTC82587.1 indolepyruvate oxidoreductase subunit beta family protein [Agrobacterium tumefaciens]NTD11410.1 indolepyruvate oxidoreductase subunit beta family protein [Agrobacterium tumefaciens]NTD86731.1 indolepyruvate oxidoreductase subunit beta family protein [Agrobacterium tumefaciens]NTD91458.1 indolepyruvate oxidoreductase subunit beta family protein [Agrobacterium tumefaciens]NTD96929.1 indolepyruvate 
MTDTSLQTRTILIAALGGEGGGTLAEWVAEIIRSAGYPCQTTSIPGAAQRTGATTYYIEYCSLPWSELGSRRPVFSLTPVPGCVDVMLASELIEAARGVQQGYVTPDRTTLIGSAHRTYATIEKMAMDDGRFDRERALKAVHDLSRRAIIFDMEKATDRAGTVISAVLLGALAGSNALDLERSLFEDVIKTGRKGVEASLRGFNLGFEAAVGGRFEEERLIQRASQGFDEALVRDFPVEARFVVGNGVARTAGYQGQHYALEYLSGCRELLAIDRATGGADRGWKLTIEASRFLALRMTYEDVIRVADLKSRKDRYATLRSESRARSSEPLRITEFFKPGPEEICAILPRRWGDAFLAALRKRDLERKFHIGIHLRSDTIFGYLILRTLARLRVLRRRSWRFAYEEVLTQRWSAAVKSAALIDYDFALEVTESADLIKGYSDTYRRGVRNFMLLFDHIVDPAIAHGISNAVQVRDARKAALSDPEGDALEKFLASLAAVAPGADERPQTA